MDLREIDLNLLVVFRDMLHHRKVSLVADSLGITQPAVSNALKRLRLILHDELFLRTGEGMMPTPFAESLGEPIVAALSSIQETLTLKAKFEPSHEARIFRIFAPDVGETHLLPRLMESVASIAPNITIEATARSVSTLRSDMERGLIDLAVGYLPELRSGFNQRRLFSDEFVCLLRRSHVLASGNLTRQDFAEAQHVVVSSDAESYEIANTAIERAGITRNVRLTVPHFLAIGHILQTTDLVAVVPKAYALPASSQFDLKWVACPIEVPDIVINMLWHARQQRDPSNQWLRQLIVDQFAT